MNPVMLFRTSWRRKDRRRGPVRIVRRIVVMKKMMPGKIYNAIRCFKHFASITTLL